VADSSVQVSTGQLIDNDSIVTGAGTVQRQRVQIGGIGATDIARVVTVDPATDEKGLVVRNIPGAPQAIKAAQPTRVTATWDTTTVVNTALELALAGHVEAVLTVRLASGAITQGMLKVEISDDGANWYPGMAWEMRSPTEDGNFNRLGIMTGLNLNALALSAVLAIPVTGMQKVRLRLDPVLLGGSVVLGLLASAIPLGQRTAAYVQSIISHNSGYAGDGAIFPGALWAHDAGDTAPANKASATSRFVRQLADRDGAPFSRGHPPRIWGDSRDIAAAATTDLIASPGAGLALYLSHVCISVAGAIDVTLQDSAGAPVQAFKVRFGAAGTVSHDLKGSPRKLTADKKLQCVTSAATGISVTVGGFTAE
jgi:hypothetical protein